MIDFLDLDDVLAAADAAVGGRAQVRDLGLLESALARPRATVSPVRTRPAASRSSDARKTAVPDNPV